MNDTRHFNAVHAIKVTNTGKKAVTLHLSHVPAGTALSFEEGGKFHNPWPVPLVSNAASVKFSKSTLKLHSGASTTFTATFTPPKKLDAALAPLYSGYIAMCAISLLSVIIPD